MIGLQKKSIQSARYSAYFIFINIKFDEKNNIYLINFSTKLL